MPRKGLGKGLDSLIPPDFYNEDFDSNSPQSLEDMLNEEEETIEEVVDDITSKQEEEDVEEDLDSQEESDDSDVESLETEEDDGSSEDLHSDKGSEEDVQTSPEVQIQKEHLEEVKKIVDKNPRITLWSSRSSAVLRYLRKTEPEFSISKEASILIDEAVSKKYPEIWALFDDE